MLTFLAVAYRVLMLHVVVARQLMEMDSSLQQELYTFQIEFGSQQLVTFKYTSPYHPCMVYIYIYLPTFG